MKKVKSIVVDSMDYCMICGKPYPQVHHCFFGPNRKIADKFGLVVPLCMEHHTGSNYSPHRNRELDLEIKRKAQRDFEEKHGNRALFIELFGKSYL